MRKIAYFVVGLLLFSSFATISIGFEASVKQQNNDLKATNQLFLKPQIKETIIQDEKYLELDIEGTNSYIYHSGQPLLPKYTTTFTLPFGTEITDVKCQISEIQTIQLSNKILPSPEKIIYGTESVAQYIMDDTIYESEELFPNDWYDITTTGGLDENHEHKTFVTLSKYPARYSAATDTLHYVDDVHVTIAYKTPENDPFPTTSTYDLVIIAPNKFSDELQKLIDHKNKYDVKTTLKTTEDIYNEYTGFDKPEQIKYFIKDAIETWGINYVLLIGGLNSWFKAQPRDDANQGSRDWYVPVRYTNLFDQGNIHDPGTISDTYYADIYDGEGDFSSWDSDRHGNSDGIYAVWKTFITPPKDIIDLRPDVIVGRLACRSEAEVNTVVNKIVGYERFKHDSNWYDQMLLIGGDSHDDAGTDYLEGEVACDYVIDNYMTEFTPTKLYASYKESDPQHVPSPENIIREINKGCGHLLFEGHGNPGSWNTHWPGVFNWQDTPGGVDCVSFPGENDFDGLNNKEEIPVCVIGGCHNSQFNVSFWATVNKYPQMWTGGVPVAECFAWQLVAKSGGGTIASFGNTGLGYGAVGEHGDIDGDGENLPDTLEAVGGYQIHMFYKNLDELAEGKFLGDVWIQTANDYIDTFPPMDDKSDAKHVQQWPILGDPTLKIGGYRTDDKSKVRTFNLFEQLMNKYPILTQLATLLKL